MNRNHARGEIIFTDGVEAYYKRTYVDDPWASLIKKSGPQAEHLFMAKISNRAAAAAGGQEVDGEVKDESQVSAGAEPMEEDHARNDNDSDRHHHAEEAHGDEAIHEVEEENDFEDRDEPPESDDERDGEEHDIGQHEEEVDNQNGEEETDTAAADMAEDETRGYEDDEARSE
jgi:hypothetical protein